MSLARCASLRAAPPINRRVIGIPTLVPLPRTAFLSSGRRHGGFSIVEILVALAIMAMVAAMILPGIGSMLRTIDNEDPDRVLWDAVNESRELSLSSNRVVWLRFEKEKRLLTWDDGTGPKTKAWPAGVTLDLLQPKEGASILIAGQLVETEQLRAVRFYPDGTCDRFRAQIRSGGGKAVIIGVDPWTCAPLLEGDTKS